ncbi:flavin reductase [Streptomyces sp. NBC_01320]|uniref:flavin reductase n=1 Tax=Streptomyces sp. NBC_01320 TaxID=2903824 RepID=UPI003FA3DB92
MSAARAQRHGTPGQGEADRCPSRAGRRHGRDRLRRCCHGPGRAAQPAERGRHELVPDRPHTQAFGVSILATDQQEVCAAVGSRNEDKFRDMGWHATTHGTLRIEGTLAALVCCAASRARTKCTSRAHIRRPLNTSGQREASVSIMLSSYVPDDARPAGAHTPPER